MSQIWHTRAQRMLSHRPAAVAVAVAVASESQCQVGCPYPNPERDGKDQREVVDGVDKEQPKVRRVLRVDQCAGDLERGDRRFGERAANTEHKHQEQHQCGRAFLGQMSALGGRGDERGRDEREETGGRRHRASTRRQDFIERKKGGKTAGVNIEE